MQKRLTERQKQLVRTLIPVASDAEIAELVGISESTAYRIRKDAEALARHVIENSRAVSHYLDALDTIH